MFLGQQNDGTIVTLAYNRDLPRMDGFGVEQRYDLSKDDKCDQFFLTRNDVDFATSIIKPYPFHGLTDLPNLIEYVDIVIDSHKEVAISGDDRGDTLDPDSL